MNKLSREKRTLILNMLVEGASMRATSRITGVSFNTVVKVADRCRRGLRGVARQARQGSTGRTCPVR